MLCLASGDRHGSGRQARFAATTTRREEKTLPKIALAPHRDFIAGYRVAVVTTAALGGIVIVGERDRCEQAIPGNKRDPHAERHDVACHERPNLRATDNWCVECGLSRSFG